MTILSRSKGFTLIELLIVVAIVGILAYLAVPSYRTYLYKSRRSEATSTLLNIHLEQEKYRANNTAYGSLTTVWGGITSTDNGHYTLTITNTSGTGFTVTATAVGDQANDQQNGTSCTPLTLLVNGAATTKSPTACWS